MREYYTYYTPTENELLTHLMDEKFLYMTVYKGRVDEFQKLKYSENNTAMMVKSFIEANNYSTKAGYSINENLYRLKYLDQYDIKSEGFSVTEKMGNLYGYTNDVENLYIDYDPQTHRCKLHTIDDTLFLGTIKNKSELKKTLQQIRV